MSRFLAQEIFVGGSTYIQDIPSHAQTGVDFSTLRQQSLT